MYQFENYFVLKIKDAFLQSTLLLLILFSYSVKANNFSEQDSIQNLSNKAIETTKATPEEITAKKLKRKNFIDSLSKLSDTTNLVVLDSTNTIDSTSLTSINKKKKKEKKIDTTHYSPKKAAIWGAGFPGLGQIYMKKYWKLPIVYGIIGGALYFVISNGQKLKKFNGYIRNVYDSVPNPYPFDELSLSELETYRNGYRKNVHLASFGTVIAWGLSIVDAVVDAHLHSFDISDKLAIKVKPQINYSNFTYYTGIGINLKFK